MRSFAGDALDPRGLKGTRYAHFQVHTCIFCFYLNIFLCFTFHTVCWNTCIHPRSETLQFSASLRPPPEITQFAVIGSALNHYTKMGSSVVEQSPSNWKTGGLIPGSSVLHVEVSLGKTLNPKLLMLRHRCMNECECVSFRGTFVLGP